MRLSHSIAGLALAAALLPFAPASAFEGTSKKTGQAKSAALIDKDKTGTQKLAAKPTGKSKPAGPRAALIDKDRDGSKKLDGFEGTSK